MLRYYFRHIIFVNTLNLDEDQITFHDKFIQKTMKFQKVHILYLATVPKSYCKLMYNEVVSLFLLISLIM